jgi:transposase
LKSLKKFKQENNFKTAEEIQAFFKKGSLTTIIRCLKRITNAHKKAEKRYKEQNLEKVKSFLEVLSKIDPKKRLYLDESGIGKNAFQEHFWTEKGQKKLIKVTGKPVKRLNIIAVKTAEGIKASHIFQDKCNTQTFNDYLANHLAPILKPGDVIIMDNARFHKSEKTEEILKEKGASILFLPPYSPDLNPIEHYFGVLKKNFRKILDQHKDRLSSLLQALQNTQAFGKS